MSSLPLDGFRIIDAATVLAGPLAATYLADFGADVIKIDLPTAVEQPMNPMRLHEERGKRSLALDLRRPEGQEILLRLVKDADVLVENFRPGTFERWNLGPARLLERNPRLIFHRLSAFGQTGPWRHRTGYDRQAQAISGHTAVTGYPDREPVRSGYATADYLAGVHGAFSILLAAYWRDARGGTGQVSDLALFEPIFRASEASITRYSLSGVVRGRTGNKNPGVVPAANFQTRDGVLVALNANNDRQWARLARTIGAPELAEDEEFLMPARLTKASTIYPMIEAWFAERTLDEIDQALDEADVPWAPILDTAAIAEHPLFLDRAIEYVEAGEGTEIPMAGVFPKLSETPGAIRSPGPQPGQHTEEILRELGLAESEIAELQSAGVVAQRPSESVKPDIKKE